MESVGISYREFINTDPPFLADIWRRQQHFRGIVDHLSRLAIDDQLLARPWFERDALILAFDGDTPVGFSLSGFGPDAIRSDWDPHEGIVSQVRVVAHAEQEAIADELLQRATTYLKARGAQRISSGGRFPFAPYFQGMYGGSRIPGVLDEDALMTGVFERAGFHRAEDVLIFQRRLAGFRVAVDMQVVKLRRQYVVAADTDPGFADWWEACTLGSSLRTRFELSDRQSGVAAARVTLWDIQPLASSWGVRAMGLYDLNVLEEFRRCGLATFLVGESLKHLAQEGVGLVEAQTLSQDEPACRVFTKHGFEVIGRGQIFERKVI